MRTDDRTSNAQQTAPMRTGYNISRVICQLLLGLFFNGRAFHVNRVPLNGGVLLVANHQSFFDPMLVACPVPRECSFMARDTLFKQPAFRRIIEFYNAFPVRRGTGDVRAIKETLRKLKAGGAVVTFPEASRTTDGSIAPMRAGVALIARKARVPLVPTLILGAFEAWPRNAKLPRPHPILVAYGDPVDPRDHPDWSDEECIEEARRRIITLKTRYETHPMLNR